MATTTADTSSGNLLMVILAVLLPPVAVAVRTGFSGQLVLSIILTLLGYIPGLIHALWIVLRK
jgi:uncharacterized membrane protein YqaE (UPF0057 family)